MGLTVVFAVNQHPTRISSLSTIDPFGKNSNSKSIGHRRRHDRHPMDLLVVDIHLLQETFLHHPMVLSNNRAFMVVSA